MKNFWKNKKVLVTGGAGFIGSHAAEELVKRKAFVTVVVSAKSSKLIKHKNLDNVLSSIKIKNAELTSIEDCIGVTKNQDIILNFAAMDGGAAFKSKYSAEIFKTNTQIVLNILESAKLNKINRVLIMSSIEVYPSLSKLILKEEHGFSEGLSIEHGYAWSKRLSEIAAKAYSRQHGLRIAIARAGNVYGPRDIASPNRARVIPTFAEKAIKGEDIQILGNGRQKKSFLHVNDLIEALLNLVEKYPVCDPVNIASSEYISLKKLAKIIVNATKSNSKIVFNSAKQNKNSIISTLKAKKVIDFKERINLEEGIKSIL